MKLTWLLALALAACTRPNPAVCCLDDADCKANGFQGLQSCAVGLACVEHQCVLPSCAMTGCMAAMPVCNITTDVCEGCTDSSQCSHFADTDVCDTASGACVECVGPGDCTGTAPICDANACRGCKLDSECPTAACGDDGSCVAENAIVYLDPGGVDAGTCTRSSPCRSIGYAVSQTSLTRDHVVMNAGAYVDAQILIQSTTAPHLFIHGGGASLTQTAGNDGPLINVTVGATIRNIDFYCDGGQGLYLGNVDPVIAEHITVHHGFRAISTVGSVRLRDVSIEGSTYGIAVNGTLDMDRAVIHVVTSGLYSGSLSPQLTISNMLVFGSSSLALDIPYATGLISSSTIADSGTDSGTGPRAVSCGNQLTIRSSIIWAPGGTVRAPVEGCNLVTTIAGPTGVAGATNTNPQFVNSAAGDYHLAANSPARDAVDNGPPTDFEGDPRPLGPRFDIGADEVKP